MVCGGGIMPATSAWSWTAAVATELWAGGVVQRARLSPGLPAQRSCYHNHGCRSGTFSIKLRLRARNGSLPGVAEARSNTLSASAIPPRDSKTASQRATLCLLFCLFPAVIGSVPSSLSPACAR